MPASRARGNIFALDCAVEELKRRTVDGERPPA
jgi:hypothetical protein